MIKIFGYDVRVKLENFSPSIWRNIIIPDKFTFNDLIKVLNLIWGFSGKYDSLFIIRPSNKIIMDKNIKSDFDVAYDSSLKINELFDQYFNIYYLYNIEDRWEFSIEITGKVDYSEDYVTVDDFEGIYNPIENCGGVWELSEIIYFVNNPDKKDNSKNSKLTRKLKKFDIEEVNELLKTIN